MTDGALIVFEMLYACRRKTGFDNSNNGQRIQHHYNNYTIIYKNKNFDKAGGHFLSRS